MSNLEKHAEFELRKAGLFDSDSDYGGMIAEAVMKLIRAHAEEGHSGMSHAMVLQVFNKVANFKTLTPLTNNKNEWVERGPNIWQSKRQPSCFSEDGLKTYYDIDEEDNRKNHILGD